MWSSLPQNKELFYLFEKNDADGINHESSIEEIEQKEKRDELDEQKELDENKSLPSPDIKNAFKEIVKVKDKNIKKNFPKEMEKLKIRLEEIDLQRDPAFNWEYTHPDYYNSKWWSKAEWSQKNTELVIDLQNLVRSYDYSHDEPSLINNEFDQREKFLEEARNLPPIIIQPDAEDTSDYETEEDFLQKCRNYLHKAYCGNNISFKKYTELLNKKSDTIEQILPNENVLRTFGSVDERFSVLDIDKQNEYDEARNLPPIIIHPDAEETDSETELSPFTSNPYVKIVKRAKDFRNFCYKIVEFDYDCGGFTIDTYISGENIEKEFLCMKNGKYTFTEIHPDGVDAN